MTSEEKNLIEKITNILLNILIFIFGFILLISIYTFVQTKILGNDYNDFFGYSMFEVQTGSMADTIDIGDWVIVKITPKVKLKDIVTYRLGKEYITHRVIEAYNGTYITMGDANNTKDEPINKNQIVGKVVKILPNFAVFRKVLFNPTVLIILIITLFLFNLAFKRNKVESAKTETDKFNKVFDVIAERIHSFLDVTAKKTRPIFKATVKKIGLFVGNIVKKARLFNKNINKSKNNIESKKVIESSNNIPKVKSEYSENYKPAYNFDEFKCSAPKIEKIENEDYYKDEDELAKTSLFRVIPVNSTEVDDKFKYSAPKIENEDYYKDEDELDKTSLYRIIPVDATEVDDTFLEIAKNEIKGSGQNNKNNIKTAEQDDKNKEKIINLEPKQEEQNEAEDNDNPNDETAEGINFNLLKDSKINKKGKNIIETAIILKKEEINDLINVLVKDDKTYVNKATIKDVFLNTYIDTKYYNYQGDTERRGRNSILGIERAIKEIALNEFINSSHGNDNKHTDMVDMYAGIFILIANLEQAKDSITESKAKNEFYKKEIIKYAKDWDSEKVEYVIYEIMKIQKNYTDTLEGVLEKLETNMFNLNFNKIITKNEMYGLELQHNITFSKVYSDYIIDKTYTEGIIAEDKMAILITLLLIQLIRDMFSSNFNRKYILYIPKSLYNKEKKFEKLLRMIEDKYAKDNVIILISFEDLLKYKQISKKVRKMGYKFALVFDKDTEIKEKDRGNIYIADYIFINKKVVDATKIIPFIPEDLLDNVIYENVVNKVGDFGSE